MTQVQRIPNIRSLVEDFLDKPYTPGQCWELVRDLLVAGSFVAPNTDPAAILKDVCEIWFCDDPRDPLMLVEPWDWYMLRKTGPAVGHLGLVLDSLDFVHVGRAGVRIEPLRRWKPRLVQIARLRCLL